MRLGGRQLENPSHIGVARLGRNELVRRRKERSRDQRNIGERKILGKHPHHGGHPKTFEKRRKNYIGSGGNWNGVESKVRLLDLGRKVGRTPQSKRSENSEEDNV